MSNVHPPLPHEVNTTSQNGSKTASIAGHRVKVHGLNLPAHSAVSLPSNMKQEILIIPSSSTPAFGSFFTIDINAKNIIVNNMYLQFNYGIVVGSSLVGYFNPSWFHMLRAELIMNGSTVDTIYGNQQFLMHQKLFYNEDVLALNQSAGQYNSTAQRTLLSSQSVANTFYVPIRCFLNESKLALLNNTDNVQLRIYMDTLANIFYVSSGTLTSCTFNSANLVMDITRVDQDEANRRIVDMHSFNHHYIFHTTSYFPATIPSGVSSATLILASIVGNVSHLLFTLRASTVGLGAWNYTQLASFAILDNASSNIVGGQALPASLCANLLNAQWCLSSYNTETSFGAVNNNANFYVYSFSSDPVDALLHGRSLGSRRFYGQEQLQLTFTGALGANLSLDCYAFIENVLEQGTFSVKKISM